LIPAVGRESALAGGLTKSKRRGKAIASGKGKMKAESFVVFFSLMMLFTAVSAFTQEPVISGWGYGLEISSGVKSGDGFFSTYSASIQGVHDYGYGLSFDYIKGKDFNGPNRSTGGLLVNSGLLGSAFLGLRLSRFFVPYIGGGLGVKFGRDDDVSFAWKVDGGVTSWLTNILYIKAGVSYDNIRESMSISAGIGIKLEKTVSAIYRDYGGSTFRWNKTKFLWDDNSTPTRVYEDKFVSSEVVKTYQKNTTSTSYTPAQYEFKTSGGETLTTTYTDSRGHTVGTATTQIPVKTEYVKTEDAATTTTTYLWNVTVTRKWYTRTWYYKNREPTTEQIYRDEESAVLANRFSETR
jgi:hypothetical protein